MLPRTRTPLATALAWLGAHAPAPSTEVLDTAIAAGRVLAEPVHAPAGWPPHDCATADGHAVQAAATEGAGEYSPVPISPAPIAPGQSMPPGADAVLPLAVADVQAGVPHATAPLPPGAHVARAGSELAPGVAIPAGTALRPPALALLALLGVHRVPVLRQPRVALVVFGHGGPDALTPMLRALVADDGGLAEALPGAFGPDWARAGRFDVVLLAGRSGDGPGDDAPAALRHAGGTLDIHGVAFRPGETAGLGTLHGTPVVLLPGTPHQCLAAYAILASPVVRGLSGLPPAPTRPARLARRISSALGYAELVPVRLHGDEAIPLAPAGEGGLPGAVQASGYVLVPDDSEGMDAGATVAVHPTR